ncbi:MAG TPA: hypothetical protein VKH19_01650 [Gemmatimonadaceae bacterium]|nr:hypothetical protein [Gemmatimonadaceae bacterium]
MSDILVLQVVVLVCGTTALVASLRFLRRYLELRHERALRAPSDPTQDRLERIELNVDTMAVEMERIAEANRFVAKLLAERAGATVAPSSAGRVITPH